MLVLPIDGSQMLLVLGVPAPQFKDKANGVAARLIGSRVSRWWRCPWR